MPPPGGFWFRWPAQPRRAPVPQSAVGFMPSSQAEVFMAFISALGFGLAAVWLVSSYLGWKHRMLALLGILLGLGVFSSFAFLVTQDVGREMFEVGDFPGSQCCGDFRGADLDGDGVPGPIHPAAADAVAVGGAGLALVAAHRAVLPGGDVLRPWPSAHWGVIRGGGHHNGYHLRRNAPIPGVVFCQRIISGTLEGVVAPRRGSRRLRVITPAIPAMPEAAGS